MSRRSRSVVRPVLSPRRRSQLHKALPWVKDVPVWDSRAGLVAFPVPLAETVPCSAPLTITSGKTQEPLNGVHVHAGPDFSHVTYMAFGLGFGGGAEAAFSAKASEIGFSGKQQFCFLQPCSDGSGSTFLATCSGTIRPAGSGTKIEMIYEVRAMCGGTVVCLETGSFVGMLQKGTPDPLHGDYNGLYEWQLQCCPDIVWRGGKLG